MQKNLGQHFLTSESAIRAVVSALGASKTDTVVEIGPGTGAITKPLLKCAGQVIAIEKDTSLAKKLEENLQDSRLLVVTGDVRDFKPSNFNLEDYIMIGNIPYYITGKILRTILSANPPPKSAVFIMQKEVAERICGQRRLLAGRQGKESILSISVKAYGTPKYVKTVKRGAFSPQPRVDSAILAIENISHDFFGSIDTEKFFALVRKGFAHKRKLLKNNLGVSDETLKVCGLAQNIRAEKLTIEHWRCLLNG